MNTRELNRDVKKLSSELYRLSFEDSKKYFDYVAGEGSTEFKRLYYADDTLNSLTKDNILRMFRMNLRHRFIAFHQFGLNIKIY